MSSPPLSERQREALREILSQAKQRAEREHAIQSEFETRKQQFHTDYKNAKNTIAETYQTAKHAARHEFAEERRRITIEFNEENRIAVNEYEQQKRLARNQHAQNKERLHKEFKESRWSIGTIFDSNKKTAKETRAQRQNDAESQYGRIKQCVEKAEQWMELWRLQTYDRADSTSEAHFVADEEACSALRECAAETETQLHTLHRKTVSRWMLWKVLIPSALLLWVGASVPIYLLMDPWILGVIGAAIGIFCMALVVRSWSTRRARRRAAEAFAQLQNLRERGKRLRDRCVEETEETYRRTRAHIREESKSQWKEAARKLRNELNASRSERRRRLQEIENEYVPEFEALNQRRSIGLDNAKTKYREQRKAYRSRREMESQQVEQSFHDQRRRANHRHASAWVQMARAWKSAVERFCHVAQEIQRETNRWFPDWDQCGGAWAPPDEVPRGIRIGELQNISEHIPHAASDDMYVPPLSLPSDCLAALLPFPHHASLLLKARDDGRSHAVAVLQSLLLRCAVALPPGKVRFTILDPVGRGENFAAFMHLADYDPLMVTSRIWTEPSQLDQRLLDLTDHMENVIQKYLRNEYETLQEYNAQAGEMAEPYRFLVVANFPVNFSAEACHRLVSLASSGARCGIYTFVSVDEQHSLPHGVTLADLERACTVMEWRDGKFVWRDPDFSAFPLRLETPPNPELTTSLLHEVGRRTKSAGHVEVPFQSVAPPVETWWTSDSRYGISVPLGKAGAIDKQHLELGKGTAQHALIAGKTGSGKSTLLHALIVQLAMHYDPDEVQMYLIDFKKGVEFKTYAVHELPHAAVVAVESEREFGLSVLKRLDEELQKRGEIFRKAGVADLVAFRDLNETNGEPRQPMPRIVLIVDEFQEFFVEEDKIAQEASLFLDRLVRQGRAFGIHILLGSQTLGGAYSLARSTLDQMAVRIALQCSESDGHLVLSKDNSAARLLTRPGEAIYNASNGAMEGNSLFQVVWLSDRERDRALQQVRDLAKQRGVMQGRQIVFEGTAPSDLKSNPFLNGRYQKPPTTPPWRAWLGEAVAIKDPTTAVFPLQSGANLLLIGQQPESAFHVLLSAMISLSAQNNQNVSSPWLHLIVGASLEDQAEQLYSQIPDLFGEDVYCCSMRELPTVLEELAAEVDRRSRNPDKYEPQFLILHGIQRMRDLRRAEDDFGFSRRDDDSPATPDHLFQHIITEGPEVGIFTLAWCDTLPNLNRVVDRRTMREFEMRVLFQMNANDSSALIDDPSASKLGPYRALFYTENQGRLEKFRPYGLPDVEWLRGVLNE